MGLNLLHQGRRCSSDLLRPTACPTISSAPSTPTATAPVDRDPARAGASCRRAIHQLFQPGWSGQRLHRRHPQGWPQRCVAVDPLWIGTSAGLSRLQQGDAFTNYTGAAGALQQHRHRHRPGHTGTLWLGTNGGGLNRLQQVGIHSLSLGFAGTAGHDLRHPGGRRRPLWLSSKTGIFRVSIAAVERLRLGSSPCDCGRRPTARRTA